MAPTVDAGRLQVVQQFGRDAIAYSTLQPGLRYLDTSYGYVAYQRALGVDLTLGPPVCAPGDTGKLLERFLHRRPTGTVFYVEEADAQVAQAAGGRWLHRCGIGVDTVVGTDASAHAERVASAARKARKAGFRVVEVAAVDAALARQLEVLTASALRRSTIPTEMAFLNRPLDTGDRGGARLFLLHLGDGPAFGYAVLDPAFEGGRATGYLLNLLRFEATKLWGVYYAAVSALTQHLRAQGVATLSLGFSPLSQADTRSGSAVLGPQMRWVAKRFEQAAYFQRLDTLKSAFVGERRQRFLVTRMPALAPTLLAFLRASRVPLGLMARRFAEDVLERR